MITLFKRDSYLKYIGTREGVELLPAGYMEHMAERPHSHDLFGDEDSVNMDAAMKELNEYPGNIWTHVISLKREDAERLGYDHAAQYQTWWELLKRVVKDFLILFTKYSKFRQSRSRGPHGSRPAHAALTPAPSSGGLFRRA